MSKRALRRHHRARVIARAKTIRRRWWNSWEPPQHEFVRGVGRVHVRRPLDHSEADAGAIKFADHLAVCSCVTCGNPRRHGGAYAPVLTRQERIADLQMQEEIDEMRLDEDES